MRFGWQQLLAFGRTMLADGKPLNVRGALALIQEPSDHPNYVVLAAAIFVHVGFLMVVFQTPPLRGLPPAISVELVAPPPDNTPPPPVTVRLRKIEPPTPPPTVLPRPKPETNIPPVTAPVPTAPPETVEAPPPSVAPAMLPPEAVPPRPRLRPLTPQQLQRMAVPTTAINPDLRTIEQSQAQDAEDDAPAQPPAANPDDAYEPARPSEALRDITPQSVNLGNQRALDRATAGARALDPRQLGQTAPNAPRRAAQAGTAGNVGRANVRLGVNLPGPVVDLPNTDPQEANEASPRLGAPDGNNGTAMGQNSAGGGVTAIGGSGTGPSDASTNGPQRGNGGAQAGNGAPPNIAGSDRGTRVPFGQPAPTTLLGRMARTADCNELSRTRDDQCPDFSAIGQTQGPAPAPRRPIPPSAPADLPRRPRPARADLPPCPLGTPGANIGVTCAPSADPVEHPRN